MRNTAGKLTFIILELNVTFINNSYSDTKKMSYLKQDPNPK